MYSVAKVTARPPRTAWYCAAEQKNDIHLEYFSLTASLSWLHARVLLTHSVLNCIKND